MVCIRIIDGMDQGKDYAFTSERIIVGRSLKVDLVINDVSVSRSHISIEKVDEGYLLEDLGSNNGTLLNDSATISSELHDGDIIKIGNTSLKFIINDTSSSSSNEDVVISQDGQELEMGSESIVMDLSEFDSLNEHLEATNKNVEHDIAFKNYRQLQAMLKISNTVASELDIKVLIGQLLDIIFSETKATRGFIMLYDDNKNLIPMAVKKMTEDDKVITVSSTIIKTIVNDKKALLSSDLLNDDRFNSGESIVANQIRSCMCAPLVYHDEVLGVIHIDSDLTANIFNSDDLELLVAISNQAAASIKNTILLKQLTEEENKRSKLSQYFPPQQVEMLMNDKLNISLGGKNESVTILFCDIRSFTAISENLNAIEVMDFLNEFFSAMTDIVFQFDGMVDNFMGDCVLAVFGGPFYHEEHATRAVEAAIAMQKAQKILNKKFKKEGKKTFFTGIGIHSGEVSRGNIGSSQLKKYTVIGSTVNVCSRLCSLAKGGEIFISETTKKELSKEFKLEKLKPCKVKNVTKPLVPYKIISKKK